ncbi:MAG: T9SS type A sorting domain-containing protein [Bacteroidia bacterium]|nr:T9SS type A sorting domain-containing protein [Bacteroidia bacterium]
MHHTRFHHHARILGASGRCLVFAILCVCHFQVAVGGFVCGGDEAPRLSRQGGALTEWKALPGPYGGLVRAIVPTAWGAWYACGDGGGVYRSDDDGQSWLPLAPIPQRGFMMETLIPLRPDIIAVGGYHGNFISRDAGLSWRALPENMSSLTLDSSGTLCGLRSGSVHVSHDSGRTWSGPTLRASGVFADIVFQLYAPAHGMLLANSRRTLYRSTDGGMSWDSLSVPFFDRPEFDGGRLFGDDVNLYLVALPSRSDLIWLFRSPDLGRTWTQIRLPVSHDGLVNGCDARGNRLMLVERRYEQCSGVLHSSEDAGQSWSHRSLPDFSSTHVIMRPDGDAFVSSYDALYHVSPYSDKTIDVGKGMVTSVVRSMAALSDSILLAGTHSILFRSTDAGATWSDVRKIPSCKWFGEQIVRLGNGALFIMGSDESLVPMLLRSDDSGATWQALNPPRWDQSPEILAGDGGRRILATYYDGDIRLSEDEGGTWRKLAAPRGNASCQAAAVDSGGRVFACQFDILRYTDDGSEWRVVTHGVPASFRCTTLLPDVAGQMFASTANDVVYRSTDRGVHWQALPSGLIDWPVRGLAADARGRVFVTDDAYTYRLDTVSGDWKRFARHAGFTMTRSFTCAASGRLFNGTHHFGVWTLDPPEDEPVPPVWGFRLLPGYPNPPTGGTTIRFETDRYTMVYLTIHDLLGRQVFVDSQWCPEAGSYSFLWSGSGRAKGVYLCTLTDGSRRLYGRLLLQ